MTILSDVAQLQRKLQQLLRPHVAEVVPGHGITMDQYELLAQIYDVSVAEGRAPTMGQMADVLAVPCNTLTRQVERLEKLDLLQRTKDRLDRRVIRVMVMSKAKAILEAIDHDLNHVAEPAPEWRPDVYQSVLRSLLELSNTGGDAVAGSRPTLNGVYRNGDRIY